MTCPAHRPRPAGPPRLQPSGFTDTVMVCRECGEVSVRSEWRQVKWRQAEMRLEIGIDSQGKVW